MSIDNAKRRLAQAEKRAAQPGLNDRQRANLQAAVARARADLETEFVKSGAVVVVRR